MKTSVLIPWVDRGCPHRRRAYDFVRAYWRETLPNAEILVSSPEPFDWGAALNRAAARASDGILLHSDPDSIVPAAQARQALELAAASDGLVVAFDRFLYLNEGPTVELLEGRSIGIGDDPEDFIEADCHDHGPGGVGNVTAYSRRTWELAGGYDERFGTWGGADGAFAYACGALVAPLRRVPGPMFHCWHPRLPESVPGGPGYARQFALVTEYRDAAEAGPDAVRALIEGRTA